MKTSNYYNLKIVCLFFIILFSTTNMIKSQTSYLQVGTASSPFINGSGNLLIGSGFTTPYTNYSKLHVRSNTLSSQPFSNIEYWSLGAQQASIQNFVSVGMQSYGIYETSSITGLMNYFQDPVKMGNVQIYKGSLSTSSILVNPEVTTLNFIFNPLPITGDPFFPLSIYQTGIRVRTNLITDNFQMLTGAGVNKVLASDANGNGTWTNPSNFLNDYWSSTDPSAIFSLYHHVGIGTNDPQHKLDIFTNEDPGGIRINQTGANTNNRSEIEFDYQGNEDWAIGSNDQVGNNSYFYIWSNHNKVNGGAFFIDGVTGKTGIGTWYPTAKFEVAGDIKATAIGIGIDPPLASDSYKLFVDGGIAAREIKVTTQTFPDYCFNDDYKLMSISDLRNYISKNRHLPGLPSAKEVEENNGIELGVMQTKLVEKVEQQTLYILDLQKQIDELKKQLESLIKK